MSLMFFTLQLFGQITADFTSDTVRGCAPLRVNFQDLSTSSNPITTRYWDFGNNGFSNANDAAPSRLYPSPGSYTVTLIVSDGTDSATIIKTTYIEVFAPPTPNFTHQKLNLCLPVEASFTNTSTGTTGIQSFQWDFGDLTGGSNAENPKHFYKAAGEYSVSLTVTDSNGCTATLLKPKLVKVNAATAKFAATTPRGGCNPPLTVSFGNTSTGLGLKYLWKFGNGDTSVSKTPSYTYTAKGNYTVSLIVTDQNGCKDTATFASYISIGQTVASFEFESDSVCANAPIKAMSTSNGARSLTWNFRGATYQAAQVNVTSPGCGKESLQLIASSGPGCVDTTEKEVYVECVRADYSISQDSLPCNPEFVTFTDSSSANATEWDWRIGDGIYWTADPDRSGLNKVKKFTFELPTSPCSPKQYWDTLYVETDLGCRDTTIQFGRYSIENLAAKPSVVSGKCTPDTAFYNENSCGPAPITDYFWLYSQTPLDTASGQRIGHKKAFSVAGSYTGFLAVKDSRGCVDTAGFNVLLGEKQNAAFTIDKDTVCFGSSVQLADSSTDQSKITERYWYVNREYEIGRFPKHKALTDTGWHEVLLVVKENECPDSAFVKQGFYVSGPASEPKANYTCANPLRREFIAGAKDYTRFYWHFGDGSPIDSVNINPVHTYAKDTLYKVVLEVYNDHSGCSVKDTMQFDVEKVEASMFVSDTLVCFPGKVKFEARTGVNTPSLAWDFGNGEQVFFKASPDTVEYVSPGKYVVQLVAQGSAGVCRDTAYQTIEVQGVQANFATNFHQCHLDSIFVQNFSQPDTAIAWYKWYLDTTLIDSQRVPRHVLHINDSNRVFSSDRTISDTLNLKLVISAGVCKDSVQTPITINQLRAELFASDSLLCVGDEVQYYDTYTKLFEPYSIFYDFGHGDTSILPDPKHTFISGTGYNRIFYQVTDSFGCTVIDTSRWVYTESVRKVGFTSNVKDTACYPVAIFFSDTSEADSVVKRQWDFGDGLGPITSASKDSLRKMFTKPGRYPVRLKVETSNGCVDSTIKTGYITVTGPYAVFQAEDTICIHEPIQFDVDSVSDVYHFELDYGDGIVDTYGDTLTSTLHTYHQQGMVTAIFIYRDSLRECEKFFTKDIFVDEAIASYQVVSPDTGCEPLQVSYKNTSANTQAVLWDFAGGFMSTDLEPTHTFEKAGTYDVVFEMENPNGCRDTVTGKVLVHPTPNVLASNDSLVCIGDSVMLWASGAKAYQWEPSSQVFPSDSSQVVVIPESSPLIFKVTGTDLNGCEDTALVNLIAHKEPFLEGVGDTTLIIGETFSPNFFSSQPGLSYQWTPSGIFNCDTCEAPLTNRLSSNQDVSVTIEDSLGCFEVTYRFVINVDEKYSVALPEAFTPNGDGENDVIYVRGWGIESLHSFEVFNRWGERVFYTNDINEGWDGTYKGEPQNQDTYVYKVLVNSYDDSERAITGYITLIR